jgi:hypothetical protein
MDLCTDGTFLCLDRLVDVRSCLLLCPDELVSRFRFQLCLDGAILCPDGLGRKFNFVAPVRTGLGRNWLSEFSTNFLPHFSHSNVFFSFSLLGFDSKP